jgi:hypothetical protein
LNNPEHREQAAEIMFETLMFLLWIYLSRQSYH